MDAFYASVEERDDPSLRGRPVVIGADPRGGKGRGVVSTANYEARRFGIHSAMAISEAYRRCPDATFLPPDFPRYKEASRQVMAILEDYADVLQVVGIDEAYLDMTEASGGSFTRARSLARSLQAAVRRATRLTCSIGIAAGKSVAKIASDQNKPYGITCVPKADESSFMALLPVGLIPGCGPKSQRRLREEGLLTIGDLASAGREQLERLFGQHGAWLHQVATGNDLRPVESQRGPAKSLGSERTFGRDVTDLAQVQEKVEGLLSEVLASAAKRGQAFTTLNLKFRYGDFTTLSRSRSFATPMDPSDEGVAEQARLAILDLLAPLLDGRPVRLVGIRLQGLRQTPAQRSLAGYGLAAQGRPPRPSRQRQLDWSRGPLQEVLPFS